MEALDANTLIDFSIPHARKLTPSAVEMFSFFESSELIVVDDSFSTEVGISCRRFIYTNFNVDIYDTHAAKWNFITYNAEINRLVSDMKGEIIQSPSVMRNSTRRLQVTCTITASGRI